jgi:hypothetical protein
VAQPRRFVADDQYPRRPRSAAAARVFALLAAQRGGPKQINQVLEGVIKNEGGYKDFDVDPFYMSDLVTIR